MIRVAAISFTAFCAAVQCAASEPLWVDNLAPFTGLLGIPSQRSAAVDQGWMFNLNSAVASHFMVDQENNETVFFDGETTRVSLAGRMAIGQSWDVAMTVPYVHHGSGFLDGIINDWHDFFGMSDGGRSRSPEDAFAYRYVSPDHRLNITETQGGLGDVSVELTRALHQSSDRAASISLGYKFATGDAASFLGSGAADIFTALRFSGVHQGDLPLTWHGQIGYTMAGDSDLLGPDQRRDLWFAGLALDWRLSRQWSLLAQYDGHSAPLRSNLTTVGESAALLSIGARWHAAAQWSIDLSFVEDIEVETAPDVTFQMNVRYRPKAS